MKKLIFLTILVMMMAATPVYAHTGMQSSTPEEGSVVKEEVDSISMTFDTSIEQTSDFELKNSSGETITVETVTIDGKTMTGSLSEPLSSEDYQVMWNIIGADGHPIEGEFTFSVDRPEQETEPESEGNGEEDAVPAEEKSDDETSADMNEAESVEDDMASEESAAQEEESNAGLVTGLIVVLLIILAGSAWWLFGRKK
ncbi:copper resistance protein CopC [Salimicrobium sp. PL1-032A]|uniref:copper resistance CopC family protein n=1 Tax=Salimicrobium sp. PL1-032A TaxID=3095364 RepID=UPI00325FF25F